MISIPSIYLCIYFCAHQTLLNCILILNFAERAGRSAVTLDDFKEAVDRAKYGVGENRNVTKTVEKQLNQWFNWASKSQRKQLRGNSEPPEGYRTVPYNG